MAPALAAERRHPLWLLARKELDLQRMTAATAGLYGLGWLATVALTSRVPDAPTILGVLTVFYVLVVPVLAGSLASAEERQHGTIEWQMLLPVSAATQWRVKIAVVWMLSLLLALGLPSVLLSLINPADHMASLARLPFILAVVAIATTSLYVSTLCDSSLRAALLSVLTLLVAMLPTSYVARWLLVSARPTSPLLSLRTPVESRRIRPDRSRLADPGSAVAAGGGHPLAGAARVIGEPPLRRARRGAPAGTGRAGGGLAVGRLAAAVPDGRPSLATLRRGAVVIGCAVAAHGVGVATSFLPDSSRHGPCLYTDRREPMGHRA